MHRTPSYLKRAKRRGEPPAKSAEFARDVIARPSSSSSSARRANTRLLGQDASSTPSMPRAARTIGIIIWFMLPPSCGAEQGCCGRGRRPSAWGRAGRRSRRLETVGAPSSSSASLASAHVTECWTLRRDCLCGPQGRGRARHEAGIGFERRQRSGGQRW